MQQPNNNGLLENDEANEVIRSFDWSSTPLGDYSNWPESLRRAVCEKLDAKVTKNEDEEAWVRLQLANEAAQLGTFDWDLANQVFIQSPRLTEIFGFANHAGVTHNQLVDALHPDDLPVRNKAVDESFDKGALVYEARVIWPDDTIRWVKVYGKVIYNSNRQPLRMYGTVQDITKERTILRLLEEEEQRSRIAIDAAHLATFDWTANTNTVIHSPRLPEMFGYFDGRHMTREDMVTNMHPDDRIIRDNAVAESLQTGSLLYEVRIIWPENALHTIKVQGKVIFDENKHPLKIYGIVCDITKEREAVKLLKESEQRLRLATESASLGTFDINLVTSDVICSRRYFQILGYDEPIYWERSSFYSHLHSKDVPMAKNAMEEALITGILNYTARIIWKNGSTRWIKKNGMVSYDKDGRPVRMIGTVMDITDERTAIAAMKESELMFKTISGAAPVGLWLTDTEGNCVFVNETWVEWTGQPFEDNMGAGWLAKVPQEDISETKIKFTDALFNRKYFSAEFRIKKIDAPERWCLTEGYPYYDNDGVFAGFTGSVADITDRKLLEEHLEKKVIERTADLKRSEERNHKMINEIQDYAILLLDKDGIIQNWNKGAEKIKGYKEEEVIGKNFRIFYTREDQQEKLPEKLISTAVKTGRAPTEGWRVRKDGSRFWASIVITALHDDRDNVIGFSKVTRDLTERKITEEQRHLHTKELSIKNYELQKQKEFVDVILDSSVDVISVFDTSMRYLSVNRKFEEVYSISREQVLNKKVTEVFSGEKTTVFRDNLEKCLRGQYIHSFLHRSPITNRHYESFFIPLKNNEEVYAVLAVAHDNTDILETSKKLEAANRVLEQRTADLKKANTALEKSNSELEQYAYVASHDLQEPLRKIRTYSGILNESLKGKADTASLATLQKVISSATRMSNLIYDLLNFSRLLNPEKQFETANLNKIFEDIISDFELVIQQKQATIQVDVLPEIEAVPLQMNQLFYNLLNNALKFSRENAAPHITITAKKIGDAKILQEKGLDTRIEYVDIAIADNGIGFSQQYAEQIFEVFKRLHTKQAYQGSGIGLALCRRIALNHQGDIYAEGKENSGSVFHVILPVKQPKNTYDIITDGSTD